MAKNITLMGADYPDVPAVQLPQTGGGTVTFYGDEYQDFDMPAFSKGATAPGTYDQILSIDVAKPNYTPVAATVITGGHPSFYVPHIALGGDTLYFIIISTNSTAYNFAKGDVKVRVLYR